MHALKAATIALKRRNNISREKISKIGGNNGVMLVKRVSGGGSAAGSSVHRAGVRKMEEKAPEKQCACICRLIWQAPQIGGLFICA